MSDASSSHPPDLASLWQSPLTQSLHASPLYHELLRGMEYDLEMVTFLAFVQPDQPTLELFFSLITFLVLREYPTPMSEFYPVLTDSPRPASEAYPVFRHFCLEHQEEIWERLPRVRLQTNVVAHCANLLPAFEMVYQRGGRKPLAMVEVGPSIGLNLLWDRYGYQYGSMALGKLDSPVQIDCQLLGDRRPPLPIHFPLIEQRVGIEIAPLYLDAEEDLLWLQAGIWPEDLTGSYLFDEAIRIAQNIGRPWVIKGNAQDQIKDLRMLIPEEQTYCVWHSFALSQGPAEVREEIIEAVAHVSRFRPMYRISLEIDPQRDGLPLLELFTYEQGALVKQEMLAECALHGEWMRWLSPDEAS